MMNTHFPPFNALDVETLDELDMKLMQLTPLQKLRTNNPYPQKNSSKTDNFTIISNNFN